LDGDRARAVAELERLLQSEPENRPSWLLLGNWLRSDDPIASARAFERAAQLDGIKQQSTR
jgi:cytochrome c-type biogenesis protein CcmH/NrfG